MKKFVIATVVLSMIALGGDVLAQRSSSRSASGADAAEQSMSKSMTFLGYTLGDPFPAFADTAITDRTPDNATDTCEAGRSWAAKHQMLSSVIYGDDADIPAEDDSAECLSYMNLRKHSDATDELDCGPGLICDGFLGRAHFEDGELDGITMVLQGETWNDALQNAITQLGHPRKQWENGTLKKAGWKGDNYVILLSETVSSDLQRYIIVYFATYDRAFHDGVCKSCVPAAAQNK